MSEEKTIIQDAKGRHYRYISTEPNEDSAAEVCDQLLEAGIHPGTIIQKDGTVKVLARFSYPEEIFYYYETRQCQECSKDMKEICAAETCTAKQILENTLWHEKMGFHNLMKARYEYLLQSGVA